MKRFSLIACGALAIMMAGCSKEKTPEVIIEPWVEDLSLPVPIQFGSMELSPATKNAPIDKVDDLANGCQIGVFGVNSDPEANWSESSNFLLYNALATYSDGKLKFDTPQYYPTQSTMNYKFYGYYIRRSTTTTPPDEVLEVSGDGSYVNVDLGHVDYLHAKAEATDYNGLSGFNAKYIREIKRNKVAETYMPKFKFRHITAGVEIWAKADESEGETDDKYQDIQVKRVCVEETYKRAKLCISNKSNPEYEGKFFEPSGKNGTGIYLMTPDKNDPDKEISSLPDGTIGCSPTLEGQRLGNDLFLYPGDQYTISVIYRTAANPAAECRYVFSTKVLEAGHKYRYTLLFHMTRSVDISVELQDWEFSDEGVFDTDVE